MHKSKFSINDRSNYRIYKTYTKNSLIRRKNAENRTADSNFKERKTRSTFFWKPVNKIQGFKQMLLGTAIAFSYYNPGDRKKFLAWFWLRNKKIRGPLTKAQGPQGSSNFFISQPNSSRKKISIPGLYGEMAIGDFLLIYNEYRNSDTREP